jgi:hypothetical protein
VHQRFVGTFSKLDPKTAYAAFGLTPVFCFAGCRAADSSAQTDAIAGRIGILSMPPEIQLRKLLCRCIGCTGKIRDTRRLAAEVKP